MNTATLIQNGRRRLAMVMVALFLAASAASVPMLFDEYAGTSLVPSVLADDHLDGSSGGG